MAAPDVARYLVDQIAADGDEGSSLQRIHQFIDWYQDEHNVEPALDESLRLFAISRVLQHPRIHAGRERNRIAPVGNTAEKKRARGKAEEAEDGEQEAEEIAATAAVELDNDAGKIGLPALLDRHGDALRLVADKQAILSAIAGNVRDLNPSQWRFLVLVSKTRGEGASFPFLMKEMKSNTQNIFFHTKSMADRGLVVKTRAEIGRGPNVSHVIATRFAHLSPLVQSGQLVSEIHEEGEDVDVKEEDDLQGPELETMSQEALHILSDREADATQDTLGGHEHERYEAEDAQSDLGPVSAIDDPDAGDRADEEDQNGMRTIGGLLAFPEIPQKEAIRSFARDKMKIRMRILKLLIASKSMVTIAQGLVIRLGVRQYTPAERRSIRAVVEPMLEQGLLCRRYCPQRQRDGSTKLVLCFQATPKGVQYFEELSTPARQKEVRKMHAHFTQQLAATDSGLHLEVPFERQIVEMVAQSGPAGTTIDAINAAFAGNEGRKRDLDRMLTTAKSKGIPQYQDVLLFSALEQSGRVRFSRFWTRQWLPSKAIGNKRQSQPDLGALQMPVHMPVENRLQKARSITESQLRPPTIVRGRPKGRTSKESSVYGKSIGRPRKDFSEKALAAAARYRAKKAQTMREQYGSDDESEDSPEEGEQSYHAAKRARREGSVRSVPAQRPAEELRAASSQLQVAQVPQPPAIPTATAAGISSPLHLATRMPESERLNNIPIPPVNEEITSVLGPRQPGRLNLTMQGKYEKLLDFMLHVGIMDLLRFDRAYTKYLQDIGTPESKRSLYEMDHKVRMRLLGAMERNSAIHSRNVMGPVPKARGARQKMTTIYYVDGTEIERVVEYGRDLASGKLDRIPSTATRHAERQPTLAEGEVDLPLDVSYTLRYQFDMDAQSVWGLLHDKKYREQLVRIEDVRSYYTGRLHGLAGRMQFLHEHTWRVIGNSTATDGFVKGDNVIDLSWWASEATLGAYLRLACPPDDEELLRASHDAQALVMPLSQIKSSLRSALRLDGDAEGCRETLSPVLEQITRMGLASPVIQKGTRFVTATNTPGHLLYRFEPSANLLGWVEDKLMQDEERLHFAQVADLDRFWYSLSRAPKRRMGPEPMINGPKETNLDGDIVAMLRIPSSWYTTYRMLTPQRIFFQRAQQLGVDENVVTDFPLLDQLAYASVTPVNVVQRYFMRCFGMHGRPPTPHSGASRRARWHSGRSLLPSASERKSGRPSARANPQRPLTKRQALRIKRQARQLRNSRMAEFDIIIEDFMDQQSFPSQERNILIAGFRRARDAYGNGHRAMATQQLDLLLESVKRFNISGHADSHNSLVRMVTAPRARGKVKVTRDSIFDVGPADRRRGRKSAFEWTAERDELLRDCFVILTARERYQNPSGSARKNLSALKQVFNLNTTTLTSRFYKLKAAVGEEAYLAQLEVEWERLWTRHRGTPALPDADPKDPTAFSLNEHVNFLRTNINKYDVLEVLRRGTDESLPIDVSKLRDIYDLDRPAHAHFLTDPNALIVRKAAGDTVSDLRNNRPLRFGFSLGMFDVAGPVDDADAESGQAFLDIASSLVKMVLATDESHYDEGLATKLCNENISEEEIETACRKMKQAHIVKATSSYGRHLPGRALTWTDEWQSFMSDANLETVPLWQITSTMMRFLPEATPNSKGRRSAATNAPGREQRSITIYRDSHDENTAAGIAMADKGNAEVAVDLTPIQGFSANRLFNAKRLTDTVLEIPVHLCAKSGRSTASEASNMHSRDVIVAPPASSSGTAYFTSLHRQFRRVLEGPPEPERVLEWLQAEGDEAKLRRRWNRACDALLSPENMTGNVKCALRMRRGLDEAGSVGMTTTELLQFCSEQCPPEEVVDIIKMLLAADPPLAFEAGQDRTRLVAAVHIIPHTIKLVDNATAHCRVIPHPWLDIHGEINPRIWHDAMALVLQAIITHPGVSLAQLVTQMRVGGLSRMDVCRLVSLACESRLIEGMLSYDPDRCGDHACWLASDDAEIALRACDELK